MREELYQGIPGETTAAGPRTASSLFVSDSRDQPAHLLHRPRRLLPGDNRERGVPVPEGRDNPPSPAPPR